MVFGPDELWRFPELIKTVMTKKKRVFAPGGGDGCVSEGVPHLRSDRVKAWLSIMTFTLGCIIFYLLSYLAAGLMFSILGDSFSNPNNAAVTGLAEKSPRAVLALTVLIAPIVEEILFRGIVFGALRPKHRVLAFTASIALFGLYHGRS